MVWIHFLNKFELLSNIKCKITILINIETLIYELSLRKLSIILDPFDKDFK